jgi:small-conductance mechanosensitive channel
MYPDLDEATPDGLGVRLLQDFDALLEISPLGLGLWLALLLFVAWLSAWGGPAGVRTAWRLGMDPRRRLGLLSSAMRLAGLLVVVLGILRPLFARAPTLGVIAVLLVVVLAGLVAPTQLRNLASGLALSTRTRLREGDLIRVGEIEGTVRDIGLLRVDLRTVDGGVTQVPASEFDRAPVTVGSRRAAVPIEAKVFVGPEFDEASLVRLRRALWLCVYRRANTEVRIEHDPETRRVVVRMDTWAALAVNEVERHVRALLVERCSGIDTRDADESEAGS